MAAVASLLQVVQVFDSPLKIKLLNMGLGGENARAKRNYNTLRDGWKSAPTM